MERGALLDEGKSQQLCATDKVISRRERVVHGDTGGAPSAWLTRG
jgi:hypothetical protein